MRSNTDEQMRHIYTTNNPWKTTLLFLTLFAVVFVAAITFVSNRFSLPSSPWPWPLSSSSTFSIPSTVVKFSSPSPPPLFTTKTALYSTFLCDSKLCEKQTEKMNKVVSELQKELDAETLLRRGRRERDKKLEKVEAGLGRVRVLIRDATINQNPSSSLHDPDYVPHGEIYRNAYVFHRSYLLMEKLFRVYIYEEGDPPLFHTGPCKDIYSTEGVFLNSIENNPKFRTRNPDEAHVYLLPFSVVMILQYVFDPVTRDKAVLERIIGDYVHTISSRYPYWNRSLGSDHFILSCHDWGPRATWYVHKLYFTSIRLLCNANTSEFFNPKKDASIPDISLQGESTVVTGGLPASNRTILAFFAGGLHGKIRAILFQYWKDNDEDIKVYERLPENVSYHEMMRKSRFCICPSGFEVATPRIPEAIYAECVPVVISQHFVLPFSDVLNWEAFSIQVSVSEIPNLKKILLGISDDKYKRLQENVKRVQRHFVVNSPPERYDVFHMILHSLWLRRLNLQIHD